MTPSFSFGRLKNYPIEFLATMVSMPTVIQQISLFVPAIPTL
jgi:hypothetical protein